MILGCFDVLYADIVEGVVRRRIGFQRAPVSSSGGVDGNVAERSVGLAVGDEAERSHIHVTYGYPIDVEVALLLQGYGGATTSAPLIRPGLGKGNVSFGTLLSLPPSQPPARA